MVLYNVLILEHALVRILIAIAVHLADRAISHDKEAALLQQTTSAERGREVGGSARIERL